MGALAQLDRWDVPNVAAAVFDPTGVRDTHGDVGRPLALASVSKVLAAITCHVAVEEGSISLDDPAAKYVDPALKALVNDRVSSDRRATILSVLSLVRSRTVVEIR